MKKKSFFSLFLIIIIFGCDSKTLINDPVYLSTIGVWETNNLEKTRLNIGQDGYILIENSTDRNYAFTVLSISKKKMAHPFNNNDTLDYITLNGVNEEDGFRFAINTLRDSIFLNSKQINSFILDSAYLTILTRKK